MLCISATLALHSYLCERTMPAPRIRDARAQWHPKRRRFARPCLAETGTPGGHATTRHADSM
eukprot:4769641-Prymnesium_polylepis.1